VQTESRDPPCSHGSTSMKIHHKVEVSEAQRPRNERDFATFAWEEGRSITLVKMAGSARNTRLARWRVVPEPSGLERT
jgi:hypothetical protein